MNEKCWVDSILNYLISKSKGDLIARQDSDDLSSPYRIEKQVSLMKNYNLDFVQQDQFTCNLKELFQNTLITYQ